VKCDPAALATRDGVVCAVKDVKSTEHRVREKKEVEKDERLFLSFPFICRKVQSWRVGRVASLHPFRLCLEATPTNTRQRVSYPHHSPHCTP
jgi:hypothetical protein